MRPWETPPRCPKCSHYMVEDEYCGDFFVALESAIRKVTIPASSTRWVCTNEHEYNNQHYIDEWEKKYKTVFEEIEKNVNPQARRFAERQAQKNDFNSSMAQLQKKFPQKNKKGLKGVGDALKRQAMNSLGIPQNQKNDKPIKIKKKPPQMACCPNHFKYKMNYDGAKVRRRKYKMFKRYPSGALGEVRSLF